MQQNRAILAFVQGTDPDAVLMEETTDTPSWRYAFGRMSTIPLAANYEGERVRELTGCWNVRMLDQQPFRTIQFPGVK
jgi:hypothetical protein